MGNVTIKNLCKRYDSGTEVLRDINLEIRSGEFVVLVGPSGCGKSTLLRMIAGLEEVTSGDIRIGDKLVNDLPPAERDIAMVFQDYALYPHMSVRDNLAFGLKIRKVSRERIDEQVAQVSSLLGLEALLNRKPAALSGGQRQRVAIGRAIVRKPVVFLFDEPLSNLDAQLRTQTRVELAALHRRLGATTIYVTHDQTEAMTLADRIVVLDRGKIQQVGAPLELYHRPANRFVASFIGNPGMNLLEGEFDPQSGYRSGPLVLKGPGLKDAPRAQGPVTLGIRPEGLWIADPSQGREPDFRAPVLAVEPLGHETLVALDVAGKPLLLRAPGGAAASVRIGETLPVTLDRDAIRWY
jgi:ABC-type sugar transport system ATPase subunit